MDFACAYEQTLRKKPEKKARKEAEEKARQKADEKGSCCPGCIRAIESP